jgi:hypothetical protein
MAHMERQLGSVSDRGASQLFLRPHIRSALLCSLFFCLALILQSYRITSAPDLFADEGLYYTVGHNIAMGQGLRELNGAVFVWHPPLYPLLEAAYLTLFGLVGAEPITAIYQLRLINVLAAAVTAGLLYQIGKRIWGMLCGSMIALIFCLDPYVQRINRRSMLETVAMMFLVLSIYLYLQRMHTDKRWAWGAILVGVAVGLSTLTKEVMFFGALIPLTFACLFQRRQLGRALVAVATTGAVYSLYPLWMIVNGYGSDYLGMKERQSLRFFGRLIQQKSAAVASGPPTGGKVSLVENLTTTLVPYIMSYFIIGVAVFVIAFIFVRPWLFTRQKATPEDRLMAVWAATSYTVIGISIVFGRGSDQFFYYIIVPAIVLVGRVITPTAKQFVWLWRGNRRNKLPGVDRLFNPPHIVHIFLMIALLCGLSWNIAIYTKQFVLEQDDSYAAMYHYITANVPPGSTLVVGNDLANFVFPNYQVRFYRTQQEIEANHVQYFILSSKERWGGYNSITPQFYDWVTANSQRRFDQYGATFWDLSLYEMTSTEITR